MPNFEFKGEEELLPGQVFMTYQNRQTGQVVKLPKSMLQSDAGRKQFNAALGYGDAPTGEGAGDFSAPASEFGMAADAQAAALEPRVARIASYADDARSTATFKAGDRETQMPRNMLETPEGIEQARLMLDSLRNRANEDIPRQSARLDPRYDRYNLDGPAPQRSQFWEGVDQLRQRAKALRGK